MARIKGSIKTGGRVAGSLDAGQRKLVTAKMAGDLLDVYERLGGVDWLLKFAKDNPAEFLRQGLSRLFPAPVKDDDSSGGTFNTQINIANLSDKEVAARVAFVLARGVHGDPSVAIDAPLIEREPVAPRREPVMTPQAACHIDMLKPEPVEDPERERWASELPLTAQERRDQFLIRQTKETNISNYAGSSAEQGGTAASRPERDPRSEQRTRMLNRNKLL